MVLHLLVLAKLNFISNHHSLGPLVTSLIWPFLIKLSLGFRQPRGAYIDVVYASSLFFFQLRQIALEDDPQTLLARDGSDGNGGVSNGNFNNSRWERAIRLVYQRFTHVGRSVTRQEDEDNFHTLSMLAL